MVLARSKKKKIKIDKQNLGLILLKARTFIALIVLVIVFAIIEPKFVSMNNIFSVSKHVYRYEIFEIGMTFVIFHYLV